MRWFCPEIEPIALALLTFCAQHPSSRWLADLLGGPVQAEQTKP
jgi:AI-2 transport protein TqsA